MGKLKRPDERHSEYVGVRMQPALIWRLARYVMKRQRERHYRHRIPSRTEIVRELISDGLKRHGF